MNDKQNDPIKITIRIGNTFDHRIIVTGRSYNFDVTRNTFICELFDELIERFETDEQKKEIKRYKIYTNKFACLNNKNIIMDAFENPNDSDLDIYDKNENLFYAILI